MNDKEAPRRRRDGSMDGTLVWKTRRRRRERGKGRVVNENRQKCTMKGRPERRGEYGVCLAAVVRHSLYLSRISASSGQFSVFAPQSSPSLLSLSKKGSSQNAARQSCFRLEGRERKKRNSSHSFTIHKELSPFVKGK